MKTFTQILDTFRRDSRSEHDKGFRFERLMQAYLKTTALYANLFEEVWLWADFPYHDQFGGQDVGIDLVSKTYEGEYWAIQCKCYTANSYIDKPAVDSFLSTSGKFFDIDGKSVSFSQRLWISTTNNWNSTAELTIRNQKPSVARLNLLDLEQDEVDWERLEQGMFGAASRPKPFDIKSHQQTAIDKTHEYFKIDKTTRKPLHERGKLIMACGTGKTFTSLKIAEKETDGTGLILFLVPSIALLGQTLKAWAQQAKAPINAICICSDAQVSKQKEKNDDNTVSTVDLALPASTDVHSIVKQLRYLQRMDKTGMTVVFSTYQSIEVISQAQQKLLDETDGTYGVFDLIICDEAHRTTGVTLKDEKESAFVRVHDNRFHPCDAPYLYDRHTPPLYRRDEKESRAKRCRTLFHG